MISLIRIKLIALIITIAFTLSACQTELYSKLPEHDINDMLAILMSEGVNAEKMSDKKGETFTLLVEKSQIPIAMRLLKEHGYPREKVTSITELFKKDGLISSPLEERVRFIHALSQSVQETLSQIDGVLIARVHIVLPENNPFADTVTPSSASVFIKYHPSSELEDIKTQIKMIVEKSIEGLSYDKVSVIMLPAQLSSLQQRY